MIHRYCFLVEIQLENKQYCYIKNLKKNKPNKISFIAFNGWMSNFLVRKYLVLRRITSPDCYLMPNSFVDIAKSFITTSKEIILARGFQSFEIVNMDETKIYLDALFSPWKSFQKLFDQ